MWNRKLRFILLIALLMSGFLFISLVSYYTANESIRTQIGKSTLPLTSDNIYSEIQRDLLRPIFISSMMAKDTFVRDWVINGEEDETAIIKYLNEVQLHYGTVTSFFVSDKTRHYYHSTGILKPVSPLDKQDDWYFRVQKMTSDYEINVDVDTANRTSFTIFINYRVYDYDGNYIGALGVGLAVNAVQKLIENYKNRYNREIYFIDKNGEIVLSGVASNTHINIHQNKGLSEFVPQILDTTTNSIEYEEDGQKHYLNSRFVPEFDWYLIVAQKENEAEQRIENTLILNLSVSFVISLILVAFVHLIISGYQRKLETMATTDKLTGCANRQIFDALFKQAHAQSKRTQTSLSALMLDIDYFKQINDTYGHPTGDVVLKTLVQDVKRNIRESDIIFRWGGEEFLILLPESGKDQAYKVAELVRKSIEDLIITFAGKSISVTISIGVKTMHADDTQETLFEDADKALYLAKEKGRNRTEIYPDSAK